MPAGYVFGPRVDEHGGVTAIHFSQTELEAGLAPVREAPADAGTVEMIVARPELLARRELHEAAVSVEDGLVGDNWRERGSRHTPDGSAELARQLTLMSARAAALIAGSRDRWALAGDQLYVDLDISVDNLPTGSRLRIGDVVLEISEAPHTGCAKFVERFGRDALRFVSSAEGKRLRLRGVNATVVAAGTIRTGDKIVKAS